jgi:hypothetical protein
MIEWNSINKNKNPFSLVKWGKYQINFRIEHPDYFWPCGLIVFCGPQGSSKTLNATLYVENLLKQYPKCIIKTNIILTDFPFDNERVFEFKDMEDFFNIDNGEYGIIYFIDEIQLYFNSLQSKNINMDVINFISQLRKRRVHIVATSQVFGRLAKPLREQFSEVILCKCYFGCISYLQMINQDSIENNDNGTTIKGKVKKKSWFFHDPKYYEKYDTTYVIERNKWVAEEEKKLGIYDTEMSVAIHTEGGNKNGEHRLFNNSKYVK